MTTVRSTISSPTPLRVASRSIDARELRALRSYERWFRKLVHAALGNLRNARLTIRDADGIRGFGRATCDGDPVANVTVSDPSFYAACALRGVVGAGEAYMDGAWQVDDLTALIRAMARNRHAASRLTKGIARLAVPLFKGFAALRRNTRTGSRRNIAAHYDLGNEMFESFLDPTMTYSCAVFEDPEASLEDAQRAKYERLCRKLDIGRDDHVLEVGTGWGGFAIHAAATRGCRVTTATISAEQYRLACERIRAAGLSDRVEVLLRDYRDLDGIYDKVVSIEMIEAVGHEYMEGYFRMLSDRLAPDGACAVQAIVNPDQVFEQSKKSVEFIRRYIFPGGHLPSIWSMCDAVKKATDLRMVHLEDLSPHYATTLAAWRRRFLANLARIRSLGYSERFTRMWEFYLCYCEGGFRERSVGVVQIVFEKPMGRHDWVNAIVAQPAGADILRGAAG